MLDEDVSGRLVVELLVAHGEVSVIVAGAYRRVKLSMC